ncbi:MAG TPA: hypothetical protein ENN69_07525, partial [Spirochaetia bacterium]|nr:hypothetical protein [Spirochaetia bacterium]
MKKNRPRTILLSLTCLLLLAGGPLFAQVIPEMVFTNAEITDILVALSSATGKSIIPDETVKGTATYSFKDSMEFEQGLQIFLSTYKMYYRVENNVYYVSRISSSFNDEKGLISMDAEDVDLAYLVRAASKTMNLTIMDESLPSGKLTVHAKDMKPEDFLGMLLAKFQGYAVEKKENYFVIRRLAADGSGFVSAAGLNEKNGLYSINIQKTRFKDLLKSLFLKAGLEYQNFSRKDQILEDLRFSDKTFDQMLRLILEQMNMDFSRVGNIYYLFEVSQRDITKKYMTTLVIPLVHVSIQDFQKILPSELASSKLYKFNDNDNSIILNGTLEEIGPIQDFITQIDRPMENLKYHLYTLNFLDAKNIKSIFPPAFRYSEPIVIPGSNSFLVLLTDEKKKEFEEFIEIADRRPDSHFIRLKYIKADDLLKTLPPSTVKENIFTTGDPSSLFFLGSDDKYQAFQQELALIDQPIPQIRYQLLVIQYNRDDSFGMGTETSVTYPPQPLEETGEPSGKIASLIGEFGSILNLNFDILGNFGAEFASKLDTSLTNSDAKVYADTTLNGISGQEIKFQNTETTRFIEVEPVTGSEATTTKTIEVSSGLIINITGWVSGNGMISMDVSATVS